jgi:hypothetical protein
LKARKQNIVLIDDFTEEELKTFNLEYFEIRRKETIE